MKKMNIILAIIFFSLGAFSQTPYSTAKINNDENSNDRITSIKGINQTKNLKTVYPKNRNVKTARLQKKNSQIEEKNNKSNKLNKRAIATHHTTRIPTRKVEIQYNTKKMSYPKNKKESL